MPEPGTPAYHRYLAAKKSIDDRSLNPRVWDSLADALPRGKTLDVLELGAGIGSMVQRVIERGLLPDCRYKAVELEPGNVQEAMRRLPEWARDSGVEVENLGKGGLGVRGEGLHLKLSYEAANAIEFLRRPGARAAYDLVIAQAFLDLVDLDAALPLMGACLKNGGLLYLCINFDGGTIFDPTIDRDLDRWVEDVYHRAMDERMIGGKRSGDSRTGRRLFWGLRKIGARVLDAGSSDWVVYPTNAGYNEGEEVFLHAIIDTVEGALQSRWEIDDEALAGWARERRAQVESWELAYIAHQLDVLAEIPLPLTGTRPPGS